MRILLCDDDLRALEQLQNAVEEAVPRCITHACLGIEKALACGKQFFIDAAFLGIKSGKESGMMLAQTLKDSQPSIPIVFVTGYGDYKSCGSLPGYIVKPARPKDITRELEHIASQAKNKRSQASVGILAAH